MNTPSTPWIDLTLQQAQRWHHLAWFLYGCLEREHVLNVDAFVAWWMRGVASPPPCRATCADSVDDLPVLALTRSWVPHRAGRLR
jgi:hypothetical protein